MQTNDSIIYPWGEINKVHEWNHNDTINTSIAAPAKPTKPINDKLAIELIIALLIYSAVIGLELFFSKK